MTHHAVWLLVSRSETASEDEPVENEHVPAWCWEKYKDQRATKGIAKASNALTKVFEAINVVIASCEEEGCLRKAADWTAIRECVEAAAVPTADPTLLKIVAPTGSRRM